MRAFWPNLLGRCFQHRYKFGTDAAERMNVTCGEIQVKQDGSDTFTTYPQGTAWEVAPKSGFTVRVALPAAYYCQYL